MNHLFKQLFWQLCPKAALFVSNVVQNAIFAASVSEFLLDNNHLGKGEGGTGDSEKNRRKGWCYSFPQIETKLFEYGTISILHIK